jgi:PAS domain S-box-containing protein
MATGEARGPQDENRGRASLRDAAVGAVAALLAAVVLYLDAATPHGYGAGVFFIVPFLVVVFGLPRVPPLAAAAATILLSAAGFLFSPSGIPIAIALVGRFAFWLIFAGIAVFVGRYRRESRERRALDDRYRALFWRHYTAVLVIDPADGRIVDANPAAARFYGYPRDTLRTLRISDLNRAPEETVRAGMQEALNGQQAPFRFVHRLAAGEERHVEVFSGPILVDGHPLLYSIVHDVTEARRVEEALRASEARYRSLVDELQEGMVLYEAVPDAGGRPGDFRVLDLNPANERMFGRRRDETVGKTLGELYPGPRHPWFDHFLQVVESGRPVVIPDFDRGGRRFEARLYRPAPGQVAGLYIDATERLQAEEALRASNADLERFAYVASHDLREPLRTIVSFAELLQRRYGDRLDTDAGEFLDYIREGGRRMERLIEALLRDARLSTGPLLFEAVDVGEVLDAVESSLTGRIGGAGAVVTHGPLPVVLADRSMLELVLANLVDNAIKFRGQERPRVHVSAAPEEGRWRISVADNGIGVPAEVRDEIFTPFRRLNARTEGYGIGLSTVKRIVERHGGSIRVDAGAAGGSIFSFTVPAAGGASSPPGPQESGSR